MVDIDIYPILGAVWEECSLINVILFTLIVILVKQLFTPAPSITAADLPKEVQIPVREYTVSELRQFDGLTPSKEHRGEKAIYLAVSGTVFDVTRGKSFYGPGSAYSIFAGRDATRGLGRMDLNPETAVSDDWDDCEDLDATERSTAAEWRDSFMQKYPVRGPLVQTKSEPAASATSKSAE